MVDDFKQKHWMEPNVEIRKRIVEYVEGVEAGFGCGGR